MSGPSARTSLARRVGFGVGLTGAMAASGLMQYALGAAGPFLVGEFGISALQLGALTSVFYVVATSGSWVAGGFSDRIGAKPALVVLYLLAVSAFVLLALAPAYPGLVVAAGVAGAALALANPATNDLVARHGSPEHRGSLIGVKQSGVQVSALGAGLLIPLVALLTGWRWALGLCALPILACLAVALATVPGAAAVGPGTGDRGGVHGHPDLWALVAFGVFSGAAYASVAAYLPLYAVDRLAMSPLLAGELLAMVGLVGVISRMVWVKLVDHRGPAGVPAALALIAACAVLASSLVALAPWVGRWTMWIAVVLYGVSVAAWTVVAMLAVVRRAGPWSTAKVSGVVISGYYGGLLLSPLIFGAAVGERARYGLAWTLNAALFAVALGIACRWWFVARLASRDVGRGRSGLPMPP